MPLTIPQNLSAHSFSQFEKTHGGQSKTEASQKEGIVISISSDSVFLDIGFKIEGVLSRGEFENNAQGITVGDRFPVSVKGRNEEGYYALSRLKIVQPTDWPSLEEAYAQKAAWWVWAVIAHANAEQQREQSRANH
jgi:small subunit ribosomal protein S1